MAIEAELVTLGTDDNPVADLLLGHVSKEFFKTKWSEEWEGDTPGDSQIEYQYAVPDGTGWMLSADVTIVGAVPVTIFIW